MIWIPYIIFQNTDDDEAVKVDAQTEDGTMRTKVSIKRENNFTRSGPQIADEVVFILFQSKFILTSTSNPFLCAVDFFLQLGTCKEAVR